jgi:hypothetical protein
MNANQLRASYISCLSGNAMNYWGTIRRTLHAMSFDSQMKTTCRSAAQLLPEHGNPANALMARFV